MGLTDRQPWDKKMIEFFKWFVDLSWTFLPEFILALAPSMHCEWLWLWLWLWLCERMAAIIYCSIRNLSLTYYQNTTKHPPFFFIWTLNIISLLKIAIIILYFFLLNVTYFKMFYFQYFQSEYFLSKNLHFWNLWIKWIKLAF